jgi:hypothetical protein
MCFYATVDNLLSGFVDLLQMHVHARGNTRMANLGIMSQCWEPPARFACMTVLTQPWQTRETTDWPAELISGDPAQDFADPFTDLLFSDASSGIVMVEKGTLRARGLCSCGWMGRQHLLSAFAINDAHVHAARQRCRPAVPLVFST